MVKDIKGNSAEPAVTTQVSEARDRSDDIASAQALMLSGALEKNPDMDPDTRARFTAELLSARG